MSPPGRPKGEYRSAQHEGTQVTPPGRHRSQADGLRAVQARAGGLGAAALSPKVNFAARRAKSPK